MLFDKNGIYMIDNDKDYDFAIDIMNGNIGKETMPKSNENVQLYSLEEALKRGNVFPELYDTYKSYRPREIKVDNAREKSLLEIQELEFYINDLNLYLDIHPNDNYIYAIFKDCIDACKRKKDAYTKMYGPLTLDDTSDDYEWSKGVWPWEEGMM